MQGAGPHMLGCCRGIWGTRGRRAVLGGGTWVKKIKSQCLKCPLNCLIVSFPFYNHRTHFDLLTKVGRLGC